MDMNTTLIDWWLARPGCVKTDAIHPMHIEAFQAGWKAAILVEREACAKVCEAHADGWGKNPGNNPIAGFIAASNCAGDIRLRSNAEVS